MRWVLSRHVPPVKKLLLVESGPRPIAEKVITQFRKIYGEELPIDLLTCLPSDPPGLTANGVRGEVFRVIDCHDHRTRWRLLRQIRAKRHPVTAIICADSPILGLWKMAALALFPSKFLIINENADFFWLDCGHRGAAQQFLLHRTGLREGSDLQKVAAILIFPFAFAYLLAYALVVHVVRLARMGLGLHRRRDRSC